MKGASLRIALAFLGLFALNGCGGGGSESPKSGTTTFASSVSAGDYHSCESLTNNTVKCWGLNSSGELGNGTAIDSLKPVTVSNISLGSKVSSGGSHSCALLTDGSIVCWGSNTSGQLGNNSTTSSSTPVAVSGIANATDVSAGGTHTCALLSDGTVKCWGRNSFGQIGNGTNSNANIPVTVSGIASATAISSGGNHTCARISDGTLKCWGANSFGQLGNNSTVNSSTPVTVSNIGIASSIAAGSNHTCSTLSNGTVQCWGDNSSGQLGIAWSILATIPPTVLTNSDIPVTVSSITTASSVTAGLSHSCAVLTNATIQCWGDNSTGQLGNNTGIGFTAPGAGATNSTFTPVAVAGISSAAQVTAGLFHTCARLSGGSLKCWGSNAFGQLGNGTNLDSPTPSTVLE